MTLNGDDSNKLKWILETSFESHNLSEESFLSKDPGETADEGFLFEIGPR